jgi:hypothetical protein
VGWGWGIIRAGVGVIGRSLAAGDEVLQSGGLQVRVDPDGDHDHLPRPGYAVAQFYSRPRGFRNDNHEEFVMTTSRSSIDNNGKPAIP